MIFCSWFLEYMNWQSELKYIHKKWMTFGCFYWFYIIEKLYTSRKIKNCVNFISFIFWGPKLPQYPQFIHYWHDIKTKLVWACLAVCFFYFCVLWMLPGLCFFCLLCTRWLRRVFLLSLNMICFRQSYFCLFHVARQLFFFFCLMYYPKQTVLRQAVYLFHSTLFLTSLLQQLFTLDHIEWFYRRKR